MSSSYKISRQWHTKDDFQASEYVERLSIYKSGAREALVEWTVQVLRGLAEALAEGEIEREHALATMQLVEEHNVTHVAALSAGECIEVTIGNWKFYLVKLPIF